MQANGASLDSLDVAPLPVWMLACAALVAAPAGLSVTQTCEAVRTLTDGRSSGRLDSVGSALASLKRRGFATMRVVRKGRRLPAHVHSLTPAGVEHYNRERVSVMRILFPGIDERPTASLVAAVVPFINESEG